MNSIHRWFPFVSPSPVSLIFSVALFITAGGDVNADVHRTAAWGTPTIDGVWSEGEWDNDRIIGFEHGVITFMRDFIRLYVLIDVIDDTTENPPSLSGDTIQLYFDRDKDYVISDLDIGYSTMDDTYNFRYVHLSDFIREPVSVSSLAHGFGCFVEDGSRNGSECRKHTLWEVAFDLNEIEATLDSTVRLGIRVKSGDPDSFTDYIPDFFSVSDFSEMVSVTLPPAPYYLFINPGGGVISFDEAGDGSAIEVTQAIQSRDNGLPLVADKDTVARMYIEGTNDGSLAVAYLHGSRDGNDLPGSPLAKLQNIFQDIDEEKLHHTANFGLPASWVKGRIELQGRAADADQEITSSPLSVQFTPKEEPYYWVVRVITGTTLEFQAPMEDVLGQQSYLETIFPVPQVRFRTLGGEWLPDTAEISNFYELSERLKALRTRLLVSMASSEDPDWDEFPDQFYGITHDEMGGYVGYAYETVALGASKCTFQLEGDGLSTCRRSIMAHEIDHNLDRADPKTWGSHVTDPATTDEFSNPAWGCGAQGPDLMWASLWNDDEIHEVGFDPRPPWENGWRPFEFDRWNKFTVVPSEVPDLMSYCDFDVEINDPDYPYLSQKQANPERWTSGYRWLRMFCILPFAENVDPPQICSTVFYQPPTLLERLRSGELEPEPTFYLSGVVGQKTGMPFGGLGPVFGLPGVPNDDLKPGSYSIELQDESGKTLIKQSFAVSFVDSEGGTRDLSVFDIQLPVTEGTARILLWNETQLLDALEVSDNTPQITVLKPVAGVHWTEGEQRIRWEASDPDGDPLTFTILYTPDQGQSWHPVAWAVKLVEGEYYYDVDPVILPGGEKAQIRVIATDGFNTTLADSSIFSVEGKTPDGYIIRPSDITEFTSGEDILFEARGYDAEDGFLADDSFVWSYNSKVFGVGQQVNAHFPEGTYQVTVQVVDSEGKTAQDSVEISVLADADLDRIADSFDNCPYLPNAGQGDTDNDSVGDMCDSCAGTIVPEEVPLVRLLVNRFALVDADSIFDTVGGAPQKYYTLTDTHGCSCTQIIEIFGLGLGHEKFGCSISAMDEAVALIASQP